MNATLTTREKEILNLIVWEFTTSEIASRLYLSEETIKSHRKRLLQKLGVRNVAGLVRVAYVNHIVSPMGQSR